MVKVLAETAFGNLFLQVFVGGCQHAYIDVNSFVAAYPRNLVLLQRPQHFRLGRQRHVAYLVQEQRPAVGLLKLARLVLDGTGKRTFYMTKQLTLNQFGRNSCTVDLHQRLRSPVALGMYEPRYNLFARTVSAGDEHTRVRRRYLVNHLAHALDSLTLAYHLEPGTHFLLQHLRLLHQSLVLQRVLRRDKQTIQVYRLLDEIGRATLDTIDGRLDISVTRNHHHRTLHFRLTQCRQQLYSIHLRHLDVRENQVVRRRRSHLQTHASVLCYIHNVILKLQNLFERVANSSFVIYDKYFCHVLFQKRVKLTFFYEKTLQSYKNILIFPKKVVTLHDFCDI